MYLFRSTCISGDTSFPLSPQQVPDRECLLETQVHFVGQLPSRYDGNLQKISLVPERQVATGRSYYYTKGMMESANAWQSQEPFVIYLDHHFCLWSCLMEHHSPFDALLRTENSCYIATLTSGVCQPRAFPCWLAPPCCHLRFRGKSWLHHFSICICSKDSGFFFSPPVKISGVSLKVEDIVQKFDISRSTTWAS